MTYIVTVILLSTHVGHKLRDEKFSCEIENTKSAIWGYGLVTPFSLKITTSALVAILAFKVHPLLVLTVFTIRFHQHTKLFP